MNNSSRLATFQPNRPDNAGVLSWVHIGDLHMRTAGQQNDLDLQAIVEQLNAGFAESVSFVLLPGDNADHGDFPAYAVVRQSLDRLRLPWCAIVGDHDVEQKSSHNFRTSLAQETHYSFAVGNTRFLALNAFDVPEPSSFAVLPEQLRWLEEQLQEATAKGQLKVVLQHCYPSDLKQGGQELTRLIARYGVKLVDMGHTHYNEISHDGRTIYTATRSTGQIEEGSVGFSIANLDRGIVSWRFLELGELPAVIITSPADERLMADDAAIDSAGQTNLSVRAKIWNQGEIARVEAAFQGDSTELQRIPGSSVWEATFHSPDTSTGVSPLRVIATDDRGNTAWDEIRVLVGPDRPAWERAERDQDNALEAWPEHGLLGTQLGPNKNGRKW